MPRDELSHQREAIELAAYSNDWQARALVMHLREEGIAAEAVGGMLSGFRAEAPALVRVMVFRRDEARAKQVLQQLPHNAAQIDWAAVDVGQLAGGEGTDDERALAKERKPRSLLRIGLVMTMIAMVVFLAVWQAFRGLTTWLTQIWSIHAPP
jgi:hypothetical protein